MKLSKLPTKFKLTIVRDGDFETLGLVSYCNKGMLVFIEDAKYLPRIDSNYVSCVLCPPELSDRVGRGIAVATTSHPRKSFFDIHNYLAKTGFYPKLKESFISSTAKIDKRAYVPEDSIHIGDNCVIEQNVVISPNTWIGDDVIIRSGSIIGSEGLEVLITGKEMIHVCHVGGVWLSDRVEVQSNCCIDKSVFGGYTRIGEDTKLGQLIHVAHNAIIGKRCLITPHAMICGSAVLGDDIRVNPAATISSEVRVGDKAIITIGSVVTKDVLPGQRVSGNFAIEHKRFIDFIKSIRGPGGKP